jgi:INO80 complex subunit B
MDMDIVVDAPDIEMKEKSSSDMSAADKLKSQTSLTPTKAGPSTTGKPGGKKKKGRRDSGTSSEEERWLDAIESGKLEEVDDELKKIKPKDPKLMTARQRAMYEQRHTVSDKDQFPMTETLMALPTGYKEKVMTAEAIQKAQIKSLKRKQLADEKREKDKKKTMERLLKKQDTKLTKSSKFRCNKTLVPMISYKHTAEGALLSFPPEMPIPLKPQVGKNPHKPLICAMPKCTNIKRYNCSRTNVPLCSFKCYKENVASIKQIIC